MKEVYTKIRSSAKRPNIGQQIATRIQYGVKPDIDQKFALNFEHILAKEPSASNDVIETDVAISLKTSPKLKAFPKLPPSNICRCVMVLKDHSDQYFQQFLKLYIKYYYDNWAINDRKFVPNNIHEKFELYFPPIL